MPPFHFISSASGGFVIVDLVEPKLVGMRCEPFVDLFSLACGKPVVFEAVEVDVCTPMVSRRTGHGAVSENVAGFIDGLPPHVLRAFPFALPNAALVFEVACGAANDELDASLLSSGFHLTVCFEDFRTEIDVVFVGPSIWNPDKTCML